MFIQFVLVFVFICPSHGRWVAPCTGRRTRDGCLNQTWRKMVSCLVNEEEAFDPQDRHATLYSPSRIASPTVKATTNVLIVFSNIKIN